MDWRLKSFLINAGSFTSGLALGYYLVNTKESSAADCAGKEMNLTKGETDNPYEEIKSVYEYLAFNYGGMDTNCMFDDLRPQYGYEFPKETAEICLKHLPSRGTRALDIGCAVGRASFELASKCEEVVGIDFSHHFVKVCNELKMRGSKNYQVLVEGEIMSDHKAVVPDHLNRERCHFQQGDACNLSDDLGTFDCVLAGNLICRLPHPSKFLHRLKTLVNPDGICVITSPYTFLKDYTNKSNWLGGYVDSDGTQVRGFDSMKKILLSDFDLVEDIDLPFLIRETYRKHQWTVSHVTVWKRKV